MSALGPSDSRILIIDGDVRFRRYLAMILEEAGYRLMQAATDAEGLELARDGQPEAILLDFSAAIYRSGERTLTLLKSETQTRNIPVIALSGMGRTSDEATRAKELGAVSVVAKSEIVETPYSFLQYMGTFLAFKNFIPKKKDAKPVPKEGPASVPEVAGDDGWLERLDLGYTVLVIDDEADTVDRLKILFRNQPYRFVWAASGERGLRMAAEELPDLVVLDLTMPGMSGQEVCRRLRENETTMPWPIPILVLTADTRVRQEAHMLDLGADDYVTKTASYVRLMARIRRLIRRRRFHGNSKGAISVGTLTLDTSARQLKIGGKEQIALSPVENKLCTLLIGARGKFVSLTQLSRKIYATDTPDAALRNDIENLQRKLGASLPLVVATGADQYRLNTEYIGTL